MITRIEIDGFKSFLDFRLDVPPTLIMLGPNGAGKSNLLDVLRLMSGTVRHSFDETVASDPRLMLGGMFHQGGDAPAGEGRQFTMTVFAVVPSDEGPLPLRMSLKVKAVAGRTGRHGRASVLGSSRVAIGSPGESQGWAGLDEEQRTAVQQARAAVVGRLGVDSASLDGSGADSDWLPSGFASEQVRDLAARHREIHDFAVRECESWQLLVLDPVTMRRPVPAVRDAALAFDGANLPVALERIESSHPDVWRRLVGDLAALVDGVSDLETVYDERRQELDFEVAFNHSGWMAPPSLSDGTLRMLGLLTAAADPRARGCVAVEEIENGMHPERVAELVRRLRRDTGIDLSVRPPYRGSYRQLIATTHSPALLAALRDDPSGSLVFLEQADRVLPQSGTIARTTVARPLRPYDADAEPGTTVSPEQVTRMLRRLGQGAA